MTTEEALRLLAENGGSIEFRDMPDAEDTVALTASADGNYRSVYFGKRDLEKPNLLTDMITRVCGQLARDVASQPITPAIEYCCDKCGASDVKLWRKYQTFLERQSLLCATCAEQEQGRPCKTYGPRVGDQIGWRVPAIPNGNGSYWGYMSIPGDRYNWWLSLKERPENETAAEPSA